MFIVYSEKEIFEKIVLDKDQLPNWYNILCNHSDICLNMTDEELMAEEVPGTIIFEFILANGGKSPIALHDFFVQVYEDNAVIEHKPRSAFFLHFDKEKAFEIQSKYGLIVQSIENIDDTILTGSYTKLLPINENIAIGSAQGYRALLQSPIPPSNAMVITDNYLFNRMVEGKENMIQLIDVLLPKKLEIPYHIALFTNDKNPDRTKDWCVNLVNSLKETIQKLRPYEIVLEVVFTKTIHAREIFLNYLNISTDKGFAIFKENGCTVYERNSFRYEKAFVRVDHTQGDSAYQIAEGTLNELYNIHKDVRRYIINTGLPTLGFRILGDHKHEYALNNRLINDVLNKNNADSLHN